MDLHAKQVDKLVDPEDAALDGMNAVHLAAKFDPKSLQECFHFEKIDKAIVKTLLTLI